MEKEEESISDKIGFYLIAFLCFVGATVSIIFLLSVLFKAGEIYFSYDRLVEQVEDMNGISLDEAIFEGNIDNLHQRLVDLECLPNNKSLWASQEYRERTCNK
jgi:hypothetical protein